MVHNIRMDVVMEMEMCEIWNSDDIPSRVLSTSGVPKEWKSCEEESVKWDGTRSRNLNHVDMKSDLVTDTSIQLDKDRKAILDRKSKSGDKKEKKEGDVEMVE